MKSARAIAILTAAVISIAAAVVRSQEPSPAFAGEGAPEPAILAALISGDPQSFRPIGSTSLSFQVDLAGSIDAAFRPDTRTHPRGWLAEAAAYRIAAELGLDNVPPVVVRAVDASLLRRRLDSGASWDDVDDVLVMSGNAVRGAFVYWVPGMLRSDLDTPAGIARWSAWLAQDGEIPEDQRALARDLSNVLVFDYLIGNRDRWSGGNARPLANGRLVIRDHNLAFPYALGTGVQQRMVETLRRTTRFSRATIAHLEELDEPALSAALAADDPALLLDERQIAAVLDRRQVILTYVGALIEAYGEEAVLYFE